MFSASNRPKNFENPNSKVASPNNGNIKRLQKTIENTNRYRVDPFQNVTNLSTFSVTMYQYKLLNEHLNFCPTRRRYNKNDVINEFKQFKRKIRFKADFALQENHDINQLIYEEKSPWEPDKNHQAVNTFIETIDNDIKNVLS